MLRILKKPFFGETVLGSLRETIGPNPNVLRRDIKDRK